MTTAEVMKLYEEFSASYYPGYDVSVEKYRTDFDATTPAQKLISALLRLERLGLARRLTDQELVCLLRGVRTSFEAANTIPTFGAGRELDDFIWFALLRDLVKRNVIENLERGRGLQSSRYPCLPSSGSWQKILRGEERVELDPRPFREREWRINYDKLQKIIKYEDADDYGRRTGWCYHEVTPERKTKADYHFNKLIGKTSAFNDLIVGV